MKKLDILFILLLLSFGWLSAQDKIDSLNALMKNALEPDKPSLLNLLSEEYMSIELEKSLAFATNAQKLATKNNNREELARSYKNIGKYYHFQKVYDKALDSYREGLKRFSELENLKESVKIEYNIGCIHQKMGNYLKAEEYLLKAIETAEKLGDKEEIASNQRTLGITYFYWSKYQKAVDYYNKSLAIRKELNDQNGVASTLQTLGIVYHEWGNYQHALESYQASLKTFEELSEADKDNLYYKKGIANCLMNLGQINKDWGRLKKSKDMLQIALKNLMKAKRIMEEIGDQIGIGYALSNIGVIYEDLEDFTIASDYYLESLAILEKENDRDGIAGTLHYMGNMYLKWGKYEESLEYLNRSFTHYRELGNKQGIADCLLRKGDVFKHQKKYTEAINSYERSLNIAEELKLKKIAEENCLAISEAKKIIGDYKSALIYYEKYSTYKDSILNTESSKQIAELQEKYESGEKDKEIILLNKEQQVKDLKLKQQTNLIYTFIGGLLIVIFFFIVLFRQVRQRKKANEQLAIQNEEIFQQKEEIQAIAEQLEVTNKELEKLSIVASETENAVVIADSAGELEWANEGFRRLFGYSLDEYKNLHGSNFYTASSNPQVKTFIMGCINDKTSVVYTSSIVRKSGERIWLQTTLTPILDDKGQLFKLVAIDSDVTKIKEAEEEIKFQKKEITDSILYASRIQNAIFPPVEIIRCITPNFFIINKPRDIVSGDFYWIGQKGNFLVLTVADCTGHGVPGAFMSLLGIAFLNEIVNSIVNVSSEAILNALRESVINALHQTGKDGEAKDGMDIALCVIELEMDNDCLRIPEKGARCTFSGANNPLYVMHKEATGTIEEVKGDKMPIGIYATGNEKPFTRNELVLYEGDAIYLFSDGYADQFGGLGQQSPEELAEDLLYRGKKYKSGRFKKLIESLGSKEMTEQKEHLINEFIEWKGDLEQLDDILLMGIRF